MGGGIDNGPSNTQNILDKTFISEGGHQVTFYNATGNLEANVKMNAPQGFNKIYEGISVAIEHGVDLVRLSTLSKGEQQRRITFKLPQDGQSAQVIVYKEGGLLGGAPDEVIMFCGNPGVGKSTLCNSIFGKRVFDSGVNFGAGLTTHQQEYLHNNKLYIDTPGLEDVVMREQAAKEIEKALKHNNNYKIVFVATIENGRIRPADLVTVNTICKAINTDFEYGIIFNQVHSKVKKKIEQDIKNPEVVAKYLQALSKMPYTYEILEKIDTMEGEENVYFEKNHDNTKKLSTFLLSLKANNIKAQAIDPLEIDGYEKRIEKMESDFRKTISELQGTIREQREQIKKLEDGGCSIL
eukprot:gene1035-1313_t